MDLPIHCKYSRLADPSTLKVHPKNPRRHPDTQIARLAEIISRLGWRHPVVVSKRSGCVVAGHGRRLAAMRLGCPVPVDDQFFASPSEELAMVMADNLIPELAEWEEEVKLRNLDELSLEDLSFEFEELSPPGDGEGEEEGGIQDKDTVYVLREDAIFSSESNPWGIPDLLPDRLAPRDKAPSMVWSPGSPLPGSLVIHGSRGMPEEGNGAVLGFYTSDDRFEVVWSDAVRYVGRLSGSGFSAVIAPDFSVWRDDPLPVQLFNRYRSMWCARYWQAVGFDVIPSLNWSDSKSLGFCVAGIPRGAPLVSVQCRTTKSSLGRDYFIQGFTKTLLHLKPQACIVYGGKTNESWLPDIPGVELILLSDFTAKRRAEVFDKKKEKKS